MKKIPTLFEREWINGRPVRILPQVTPGFEWVLNGEGIATIKVDGSCCAIIDGIFYKRYDAKKGKPVPENAIKCQEEADPITGHLPCWVPCDRSNPVDKWFWAAYDYRNHAVIPYANGTYEAVGNHFTDNPYGFDMDMLLPHGHAVEEVNRTFEGIRDYLTTHYIEGLVFWKDGGPQCKIKRTDFGFPWGRKR